MKTVLLPFLNKKWKREESENALDGPADSKKFLPPSRDPNAPDLYLPLMSFITYIVICSYVKGTNGKFTPEVLNTVMYWCLLCQLLEVLLIRAALYVLGVARAPLLDLTANTGYKYIGLCLNMLMGLFLGRSVFLLSTFYTASMAAFFMLKTLSNNYPARGEESRALRMPILWRSIIFISCINIKPR